MWGHRDIPVPSPCPASSGHGLGWTGSPVGAGGAALVRTPQQGAGSRSFPSPCLAVTLASIRNLGHLVAWRGLGPAPDISWACQLDQSVSRAMRALCHLPPLTPAVLLERAHGFSQSWNPPVSALCRQHSLLPIHRCQERLPCWAGPTPSTSGNRGRKTSDLAGAVGMHTYGGCPLFMGRVIDTCAPRSCRCAWHCPHHPSWPERLGQSLRVS